MNLRKKVSFILNGMIVVFVVIGTALLFWNVRSVSEFSEAFTEHFKYFTILSNVLCGVTAFLKLISDLKGEEDRYVLLKYISAVAVALTFLIVAGFLQPLYPERNMYRRWNFWFHLVVPVIGVTEFLVRKAVIPFRYTFFTVLTCLIYGIVYLGNNLINGVGEGPKNDWYGFMRWGVPAAFGIFGGIIILAWLIAIILRLPHRKTAAGQGTK